jgi:energy-coupling factor transporter ATP-binding protein EcfA2
MKNNIEELKKVIGKAELTVKSLPEGRSLNALFLSSDNTTLKNFLYDGKSEVEEVQVLALTNAKASFNLPFGEEFAAIERTDTLLNKTNHLSEASPLGRLEGLTIIHEDKLLMKSTNNYYYVLGMLGQELSSMRVTLMIEQIISGRKERIKIDLYEREALQQFSNAIAETFNQDAEQIFNEFNTLTDLLENFREEQLKKYRTPYQEKRASTVINKTTQEQCIDFLSQPDLIANIDKQIEKTGVVGEENMRKLLFVIASTYKMNTPLHALVQGSSGSGKSHLINTIGQCLPPEDVLSMTRVTSKSFYHYNKNELMNKLILIQDYNGLDEEAQYAFRELQSAGNISSSTTYKDRTGNIVSCVKNVRSHFASLLATTKAEVYYDNMSRSLIIGMDESEAQTLKIIDYQNKRLAGLIDTKEEQKAKEFLQNCMRCIKSYEVVNTYADKITLPLEAKMHRRLNSHYQAFVKQITILHQYQRKKDEQGRLIAEPEDLKIACDILFDAIMLKVDDLDSSLRQFFDRMKTYIKNLPAEEKTKEGYQFTQRDVRLALNVSKTKCFNYMEDLRLLEYVQKIGGYANRGFKYKIVFWDDMEKLRQKIKTDLNNQLTGLQDSDKKIKKLPLAVHGGFLRMEHQNPQHDNKSGVAV